MNMDVIGRIKCIDNNGWEEFIEGRTYTVYFNGIAGTHIKIGGKQIPMEEVERKIYFKKISGEIY